MKKLFAVILTVFFMVAISYAQYAGPQTATVSSTGDYNGAFVEQIGSPNLGTITQTGNKNNANTVYSPSWGIFWDAKGITQHGSGNEGHITQTGQNAPGYSANFAAIGQVTNNNYATITQIQTDATNPWGGITGVVEQKGGSGNHSTQYQKGYFLNSTVWQEGAINEAQVKQDGIGMTYTTAKITQNNDQNHAYQEQIGNGAVGNHATVTQEGDHNYSFQYQYGNGNNSSTITQEAGNNKATTTQTTTINPWVKPGNTATIDQLSSDNEATVTQTSFGMGLTFTATQKTGTNNYINLDQTDGVTGGSATIMQDGSGNRVEGVGSLIGISHNGSTLNVTQLHDNNVLYLDQNNGATATVTQDGITNTAVVIQN